MYEKTKPELLDRLMKTTSISGRPSVYLQEMINTASRIGVTDANGLIKQIARCSQAPDHRLLLPRKTRGAGPSPH